MSKLYECTVTFTYYARAENAAAAQRMADEAVRDELGMREYTQAVEVGYREWAVEWPKESLIYGTYPDNVTLGEALAALPYKAHP
jgi:hypothetical protein